MDGLIKARDNEAQMEGLSGRKTGRGVWLLASVTVFEEPSFLPMSQADFRISSLYSFS